MSPPASVESLVGEIPEVAPLDPYNRALVANVHPTDWVNSAPAARYNLVVLGAGTAGLVTAAGAAGLGAKVALAEKKLVFVDFTGETCTNCKLNEKNVFPKPEVKDLLKKYTLVQLFTDKVPNKYYSAEDLETDEGPMLRVLKLNELRTQGIWPME